MATEAKRTCWACGGCCAPYRRDWTCGVCNTTYPAVSAALVRAYAVLAELRQDYKNEPSKWNLSSVNRQAAYVARLEG